MELIGVNVMDGETVVNDRTRSRSNLANVTIVMELVEFLISRDVFKGKTSTIITTYADQKKLYVRRLMKLSEKLSITWEDMVKIATVDSYKGIWNMDPCLNKDTNTSRLKDSGRYQ